MNELTAICPECRAVVETVRFGNQQVCIRCGAAIPTLAPRDATSSRWVKGILGVAAGVFLVVVTLVLVGIGILFIGCSQLAKNM